MSKDFVISKKKLKIILDALELGMDHIARSSEAMSTSCQALEVDPPKQFMKDADRAYDALNSAEAVIGNVLLKKEDECE